MSFLSPKYPRKRVSLDCGETMTEQSHAKACDVNRIVKRYERDGIRMSQLPGYIDLKGAQFGDFTKVTSYQDACNQVIKAESSFMELPSALRAKFSNDVGHFLDFVSNPDNKDEMIKLGLLPEDSDVNKGKGKYGADQAVKESGSAVVAEPANGST